MPLAIEQLDLTQYDLILSSSHAVAKGVITGPGQLHISYVHSPMRYAWDLQTEYLQQMSLGYGLRGSSSAPFCIGFVIGTLGQRTVWMFSLRTQRT